MKEFNYNFSEKELIIKNKITNYTIKYNKLMTAGTWLLSASLAIAIPVYILLDIGLLVEYGVIISTNPNEGLNLLIITAALGAPSLLLLIIGGIIMISGLIYKYKIKKLKNEISLNPNLQIIDKKIDIYLSLKF